MRARLGLRGRFLLATLSLAVVFIGGFTLVIHQFLDVLESELVQHEFRAYLDEFVIAYEAAPDEMPRLRVGYKGYVVRDGDFSVVPSALRALPAGIYGEFPVDGREHSIGRRDVPGASLFLLADSDLDPVERIEDQLLHIALMVGCAALLIAAAMALWLARVVLRPVQALARNTSAIEPGRPRAALVDDGGDNEIGLIARAFDRTLDRYDDVVERERSFTRDASHELRTPLAVMLTGIELLEAEPNTPAQQRLRLGRIRSAAEQMRALTEGLLFLARPTPGDLGELTSVSEVIEDAVRIQRLAAPANGITLSIESERLLAVPRGLLLCVVNNLLRNALEHAGGGAVQVILTATMLQVADHGAGIDSAIARAIFEPRVRGAASSGEGLGLNIVKRICDRLGWRIDVDSTAGRGTRFNLHLQDTPPA